MYQLCVRHVLGDVTQIVDLIKGKILLLISVPKQLIGLEIQVAPDFKTLGASIAPNGKVTSEVTNHQCQEQKENFLASVIISDFCTPHDNFDLPLIMPAGTLNYLM